MGRRQFTREFTVEAVRLFRDRGVSLAQAPLWSRRSREPVAEVGQGFRGRPSAGVSRSGQDETRAGRDRAAAARSPQAQVRAPSGSKSVRPTAMNFIAGQQSSSDPVDERP